MKMKTIVTFMKDSETPTRSFKILPTQRDFAPTPANNVVDLPAQGLNKPAEHVIEREPVTEYQLKRIIRDIGLKVTQQRLAILKTLHEGRHHVTAQEIFESVCKDWPEMGFATVYRFLRDLADHNVVTEVRMGGLPARYELNLKKHHDHLTCSSCGAIFEFQNYEIERLQEEVARKFGFILTSHLLELYGICGDCQQENK